MTPLLEVHDATNRWVGEWRHFHQVEVLLLGQLERIGQRLDAELLPVGCDHPHFTGADAVVDARLGGSGGYGCSLLCNRSSIREKRTPTKAGVRRGVCDSVPNIDPDAPLVAGWRPCGPASSVVRRIGYLG